MSSAEEERGQDASPSEPARPKGKSGGLAAVGAAVGGVLLKFKGALGMLKFLSVGKLLMSGGSMFLYLWYQASRHGWSFGLGFVLLLFIHEMGHAVVIRKHGLRSGWPLFIPGLGAMIALKDTPPSREVDAEISLGGPLWGTVASFAVLSVFFVTRSEFWLALGYSGLFLNMFNLTPVRPLDGGAIAEMFSRKAWIPGALILVFLMVTSPASPALIMMLFMLPRVFQRNQVALEPLAPGIAQKWALRYFGLLGFMGAGLFLAGAIMHR
jgi:Zn-dependent protease